MEIMFVEPRPELRRYVQSIWSFENEFGLPLSERSLVTPTGNAKLIISCENGIIVHADGVVREKPDQTVYLLGVRDVPVALHTKPARTLFIGIDFFPHTASAFLRLPMSELTNRLVGFEEVFTELRREVEQLLPGATEPNSKIALIQDILLRRLQESTGTNSVVEYCVEAIRKSAGLIAISELEERTGYSRRYLEMLFKNHVGITPKTLAGIVRFQKLYRKWAGAEPYESIIEEIYESYYDQAHFTKEFKRMTGFAPRQFVQEVTNEFGRRLTLR